MKIREVSRKFSKILENSHKFSNIDENSLNFQYFSSLMKKVGKINASYSSILSTICENSAANLVGIKPRMSGGGGILAIGRSAEVKDVTIEWYSRRLDKWAVVKTISGERTLCASVLLGNEIIMTGGQKHKHKRDFMNLVSFFSKRISI